MEQITLYYRQGSSDKVYAASIQPKAEGHLVLFQFGRRGSTLQVGQKTAVPVSYPEAKGIYDKLVREKIAKGYTPGANGSSYQQVDNAGQSTGILPQLLNPVEAFGVNALLRDPAYWMQEKFDGRRLLLRKEGDIVIGINRTGRVVALPDSLIESAQASHNDFLIDGELVGEALHVFDVLFIEGDDLRTLRYSERYSRLRSLLKSFEHPLLHLAATFVQTRTKEAMFRQIRDSGREGVVFKHADGLYAPGRPASGGPQHKHKFHETASFIVAGINRQRSVALSLYQGSDLVPAGNVTIPPNHSLPSLGDVVECRYLYAFPESGCIYQPVYLGPRDDVPAEHCCTSQLKYKPQAAALVA